MKRNTGVLILILVILAFCLVQASCQSTPAPAPTPDNTVRAGTVQGRHTAIYKAWSTTIATTTEQTADFDVGNYATAQVWLSADVDAANNAAFTMTVGFSPDATNYLTNFSSGTILADKTVTYTALSDIGKYVRFSLTMSNTSGVTPTIYLLLKD